MCFFVLLSKMTELVNNLLTLSILFTIQLFTYSLFFYANRNLTQIRIVFETLLNY